jgi:hypothetical protein
MEFPGPLLFPDFAGMTMGHARTNLLYKKAGWRVGGAPNAPAHWGAEATGPQSS